MSSYDFQQNGHAILTNYKNLPICGASVSANVSHNTWSDKCEP
jgi:hypothetical protein